MCWKNCTGGAGRPARRRAAGARNPDGSQVHLLAALAGWPGVVAAQAEVGAKTNEIPMIITLLDGVDLDRAVVTADALHCQRATADYLHGRGADFILPAKDNQPRLFDALDALPWRDVPVARAATDRGHGRIETRTIQLMDAPGDLPFPHVSQAYLIERHVTALDGTPVSDIAALGVTSLDATRASPRPSPAWSAAVGNRSQGQGSYQEVGQYQERCQIVAPISNDDRPAVRASRSLASVPAGTRKGVAHHGRERTVRQGPSSAAGCPGR